MSKSLHDTVMAKFSGVSWPPGEGPHPSAQCLRALRHALNAIGDDLASPCLGSPVIINPTSELSVREGTCSRPLEDCIENALSALGRVEYARANFALRCQLSDFKSEHAIVVHAEHSGNERSAVYHLRSTLYITNYRSRGRPAKFAASFDAHLYRRPLRAVAFDSPMGTPIAELRRAAPPPAEED